MRRADPADPGFDALNDPLLEHKALIFRGTDFDDDGQIAFASRFDTLT